MAQSPRAKLFDKKIIKTLEDANCGKVEVSILSMLALIAFILNETLDEQ